MIKYYNSKNIPISNCAQNISLHDVRPLNFQNPGMTGFITKSLTMNSCSTTTSTKPTKCNYDVTELNTNLPLASEAHPYTRPLKRREEILEK